MEETNITLSEQIVYGMFKPASYKQLVSVKKGRSILYIMVMMLALCIVTFAVPAGAVITGFGGFEQLFTKNMGELKYSDGKLSLDRPFEMSFDIYNIIIDTEDEMVADEKLHRDGMNIAIGSGKLRISLVMGQNIGDYSVTKLSDIFFSDFDNDTLVSMIPTIYISLVLTFIFTMVGLFIKYAMVSLVFCIVAQSINKSFDLKLSFGQVFMLCFYGQSLGMVLSNCNAALGLLPPTIITILGMFISIRMVGSSLVYMKMSRDGVL